LLAPRVVACVMGATVLLGCSPTPGPPCDVISMVEPVITITDATTGKSICDADVIARCGDGGGTLVAFGPSGNETDATVPGCHYGPGLISLCDEELSIVATVSVSKHGYNAVTVPDVEVRQSTQCPGPDPEAQQVHVALEPDSIGSPAKDAGANATVDD
jgi:hypothetical protein